jgi:hypothetical protein
MEKIKLLQLLKKEERDIEAIRMILSNYVDYGGSSGGLVSVNQFTKVAECLIEWFDNKKTELIEKYQIQLDTVKEVIEKSDKNEDTLTAQAVERFIKGFIKDLKSLI